MRTHKPAVTRVPQRILVDTGLFFAYYEPGDQYHEEATIPLNTWWDQPGPSRLVVAFPVLYETLNTRFVQDRRRMAAWTRNWSAWRAHGRLEYCDDEPYRLKAFDECVRRMRSTNALRQCREASNRIEHSAWWTAFCAPYWKTQTCISTVFGRLTPATLRMSASCGTSRSISSIDGRVKIR